MFHPVFGSLYLKTHGITGNLKVPRLRHQEVPFFSKRTDTMFLEERLVKIRAINKGKLFDLLPTYIFIVIDI